METEIKQLRETNKGLESSLNHKLNEEKLKYENEIEKLKKEVYTLQM